MSNIRADYYFNIYNILMSSKGGNKSGKPANARTEIHIKKLAKTSPESKKLLDVAPIDAQVEILTRNFQRVLNKRQQKSIETVYANGLEAECGELTKLHKSATASIFPSLSQKLCKHVPSLYTKDHDGAEHKTYYNKHIPYFTGLFNKR